MPWDQLVILAKILFGLWCMIAGYRSLPLGFTKMVAGMGFMIVGMFIIFVAIRPILL